MAAVLVAAFCFLFATAFHPPLWFLMQKDSRVTSDFLVVLGGDDDRARYAAQCFHEGVAPRILVSGYGDAYKNRDLLLSLGVPSQAIMVESLSRSTLQNARFSVPILRLAGAQKVVIVTSWYHSSRAYATFQHEAPTMTFASLSVKSNAGKDAHELRYTSLEVIKRVWYLMRYGVPLF